MKGGVRFIISACLVFCLAGVAFSLDANVGWPEIFDPDRLLTFNLELTEADWQVVVNDVTLDIEKPAWFWADDEVDQKIYVSVRRKSGDPIPSALGGSSVKISLKIDINEYFCDDPMDPDYPGHPNAVDEWHGMKKFSLENGDDNNVLTEGLSANMHTLASCAEGYGHDAWRTNWVKLYVNGEYRGVYVNAEHLDKTFLIHRDVYVWHETWLYQYRGEYDFTLEIGDDLNPRSPAVNDLNFLPFAYAKSNSPLHPDGGLVAAPVGAALEGILNEKINMQSMLSMAAVNAFVANPDSLFSHQRNSHFLDFNPLNPSETRKRYYYPWDIDAAMQRTDFDIYGDDKVTEYQTMIFGNAVFRAQYDQIMTDLINSVFTEANISALIDRIEPAISQALADDPYNKFSGMTLAAVQEEFDGVRAWYIERLANVRSQLGIPEPDADGDGVADSIDNCPFTANANQEDADGDDIGDACDRCDGGCLCDDVDLYLSGHLDFSDFALLGDGWQNSGANLVGDINGDETVDIDDLKILADYWLDYCN